MRVDNSYVLGPGGVVWRQHIIDDWTQFQSKKNSPLTATPKVEPQRFVDEQKRLEYSLQMPDRSCPPGTPAEKPDVYSVAKGKGKGKRTTASSSWEAPSSQQGAQPSASVSGRNYQRPDPQSWNQGSYWRR